MNYGTISKHYCLLTGPKILPINIVDFFFYCLVGDLIKPNLYLTQGYVLQHVNSKVQTKSAIPTPCWSHGIVHEKLLSQCFWSLFTVIQGHSLQPFSMVLMCPFNRMQLQVSTEPRQQLWFPFFSIYFLGYYSVFHDIWIWSASRHARANMMIIVLNGRVLREEWLRSLSPLSLFQFHLCLYSILLCQNTQKW